MKGLKQTNKQKNSNKNVSQTKTFIELKNKIIGLKKQAKLFQTENFSKQNWEKQHSQNWKIK